MEYDSLVYAVAFSSIFDSSVRKGRAVLRHFGSFESLFSMSGEDLNTLFPHNENIVSSILNPRTLEEAYTEVKNNIREGISIIPITDSSYPYRFRECDDASPVLFYRGNCDLNSQRILGIVGTRRCSYYGKSTCKAIVEKLSDLNPKPVIVSGLAYGIDECAHLAAMDYNLPTICVIPSCISRVYPAGHRNLAVKIEKCGGILSDRHYSTQIIDPGAFHRRNRIIAGISDATLLVESFAKGGGLITTAFASSYDRDVFAVPGRIGDHSFEGCNNLIGNNIASIVTNSDTIPLQMGWQDSCKRKTILPTLFPTFKDPLKQSIADCLSREDSVAIEDIASATGYPIYKIISGLTELEVEGHISCTGGDRYSLVKRI